jgi:hypothetical protein
MNLLLVHGMARTSLSLVPLALYLRRRGHEVTLSGYVAALEPFDAVCDRVRRHLERLAAAGAPYALIGHSLGGLILRIAVASPPLLRPAPRGLIMLGTPNRLPRLALRFRRLWPYRIINGEAGRLLADPGFFTALPPVPIPYTVIAGTGGSRGRWSPFAGEPNDGIVAVSETLAHPDDAPILVPALHTFLMDHRGSRRAVARTLDGLAG